MSEPPRHWISIDEYLQQEELTDTKSEYFNGEVFAMAGDTAEHNLICTKLVRELDNQLEERPCLVYGSDQQVKILETGLYTYPDLAVMCAEPQFEDAGKRGLLNPTLIIEVLSPTTEGYDRGDKFAHYRRLSSLREYVLVASDKPRIERFSRQKNSSEWLLTVCREPDELIELPTIRCTLSLDRVYRNIEFLRSTAEIRPAPGGP